MYCRASTCSNPVRPRRCTPIHWIRHSSSATAPSLPGSSSGANGPGGLHGVAPGATVLPIRVAGWQPGTDGRDLVYARSDQLIAGLDRAADPNGDGDAHDAVRVALIGVTEPYGAFTDDPEALAVQGALDLNTVVVVPAGNDGAAGPAFGSIAGPGASPAAIAVAATDSRADAAARPHRPPSRPRRDPRRPPAAPRPRDSVGTLHASGRDPARHHRRTRRGRRPTSSTPTGSRGSPAARSCCRSATTRRSRSRGRPGRCRRRPLLRRGRCPRVRSPSRKASARRWSRSRRAEASELLASQRAGVDVGVALGATSSATNGSRGSVASFSSQGLAFDSSVKPDVAAPGIATATAEPGSAPDGSELYGTVTGTSAAAAEVAGAAARSSFSCGPHSTPPRCGACWSATRSRAARRSCRRVRARSASARPRSARSPPIRRRSASASGAGRTGTPRVRSCSGTSRRAGCMCR